MTRKNKVNSIIYFLVCLLVIIVFDLKLTSHFLHNIFLSSNFRFVDIVYVQNSGAAFSSFQHATGFLITISIIAIIGVIYELFRNKDKYSLTTCFCCAMLCAGIICNTYERLSLGYVRDFLSLKFIEFPVFNISDILINIGVFALIVLIITKKYKKNV